MLLFVGLAASLVPVGARAQAGLTLHQAVQRAMEGPRARIAAEQVDVVRAQRVQASLTFNPRLFVQSEDLHPWSDNFSFPDSTEDYAYIGQTFEFDGKRSKRVAVADTNIQIAEAQRQLQGRLISGHVAVAYWTAAADRDIAVMLRQNLAAVDAMVKYHKERVDAGAMRGVDLIRIQIERDRVSLSLQSAERDAELALTELYRQMGSVADEHAPLLDDIATTDTLPEADLATALAQRAEVAIAKQRTVAAKADLWLEHANAVPDLDLLGGYKRDVGINTAYAGPQIPLPLRNRNQGEIARAESQVRIAEEQLKQDEIVVQLDIEAATKNYHRELAIVHDTLPQMRERAKQNLSIETEAYQLGGVDLLRYIDAERTAYDVEVTAIRTLADFHQAEVRLLLAYGGQP